MKGLAILDLPRAFRDGIGFARYFGVHYLWIDSLCIMQDHFQDWEIVFGDMYLIWKNNICNISATSSVDSDGGLLDLKGPRSFPPQVTTHLKEGSQTFNVINDDIWSSDGHQPLNSRGCAFQERLISPKILHFNNSQMFWECREMRACESFPGGSPSYIPGFHAKPLDESID
jgi:Heterokaryon incompatibility protein (HET)